MGPNDGGIKRGDSAETGDLEARPTETVDAEGSGAHGGGGGPDLGQTFVEKPVDERVPSDED